MGSHRSPFQSPFQFPFPQLWTQGVAKPQIPLTLPISHHHHVAALPHKAPSATAPKLGIFYFLLDLFLPPFSSNPAKSRLNRDKEDPSVCQMLEQPRGSSSTTAGAGASPMKWHWHTRDTQGHSTPAILRAKTGNIGNSSSGEAGKKNPRVSMNVLPVLNNLGLKQIEFGLCHHNEVQGNFLKINEDLGQ